MQQLQQSATLFFLQTFDYQLVVDIRHRNMQHFVTDIFARNFYQWGPILITADPVRFHLLWNENRAFGNFQIAPRQKTDR